jgi:D-tyrosyl-tRNA(Tyr) deacylase
MHASPISLPHPTSHAEARKASGAIFMSGRILATVQTAGNRTRLHRLGKKNRLRSGHMRAVVQRVSRASVSVGGQVVGEIDRGLLVLFGAGAGDGPADLAYIVEKTANLRIFPDEAGKMNRSVLDIGGSVLVVSQFTLYGDARQGRRPAFTAALEPVAARALYDQAIEAFRTAGVRRVEAGEFGADMEVELVNDGPVTILLESRKLF